MSSNNSNRSKPEHLPGKGEKGKLCNREACQKPGAVFLNKANYLYYCSSCAFRINEIPVMGEALCIPDEEAKIIAHKLRLKERNSRRPSS